MTKIDECPRGVVQEEDPIKIEGEDLSYGC